MIPDGFLEAQAIFETPAEGGPAMVVTGHVADPLYSADLAATTMADTVWNAFGGLLTVMSSGYTLVQLNTYLSRGGPDLEVGQWNGSNQGTAGGAAPPQVAALIQKQSGLAGRANRGRMYVPGPVATQIGADGDFEAPALTSWQAAANVWFDEAVQASLQPVILHTNPAIAPTTITALSVQVLSATQRRRVR